MCEGALRTVTLTEEVLLKDEVLILLVACGESVKVDSKEAAHYPKRPITGIKQCFALNNEGIVLCICILLK